MEKIIRFYLGSFKFASECSYLRVHERIICGTSDQGVLHLRECVEYVFRDVFAHRSLYNIFLFDNVRI
jgi:hypothetical protein